MNNTSYDFNQLIIHFIRPRLLLISLLQLYSCQESGKMERNRFTLHEPSDSLQIMPDSVIRYLNAALDLMQQNSVFKDSIDWPTFRNLTISKAKGAQSYSETYYAISDALDKLGDNHSFLISPVEYLKLSAPANEKRTSFKLPSGIIRGDKIALIYVPQFSSSNIDKCVAYATELQNVIKRIDAESPIGWMVDLENNRGGNMWPMLVGVGPLLSREGIQGYFLDSDGQYLPWLYEQGEAKMANQIMLKIGTPYKIKNPKSPIALKVSDQTASSGEAIVITFMGQPNAKVFGAPTAGLTTANAEYRLIDEARLILTSGVFVDAECRVYGNRIIPDVNLENDFFYKVNYRIREPIKWIKKTRTTE